MERRVLLVEDEPGLVMTLTDRLSAEGYTVDSRQDGDSGLEAARSGSYDLVLLDIALPKRSGLDVCRQLRQSGFDTPIVMLTARGQMVDKVVGLQLGADDYITKPFDMPELLARMEAVLRRSERPASATGGIYRFGNITVNIKAGEVTRDGEPVALSAREFQLLRYLIEHRGNIVSRDELLKAVWGYEALPMTRTVDVHVTWLRQKLETNPRTPEYITTVRGLGYKFTA